MVCMLLKVKQKAVAVFKGDDGSGNVTLLSKNEERMSVLWQQNSTSIMKRDGKQSGQLLQLEAEFPSSWRSLRGTDCQARTQNGG